MKKLLLFVSLLSATNLRCDDLSDAIRATDVEKVRTILEQSKIVIDKESKYLVIAKCMLDVRQYQLCLHSPNSSLESDVKSFFIKCAIVGLPILGAWLYVLQPRPTDSDELYLNKYRLFKNTLWALPVIGLPALQYFEKRYKVQFQEKVYKDASIIYELIYDRVNQK